MAALRRDLARDAAARVAALLEEIDDEGHEHTPEHQACADDDDDDDDDAKQPLSLERVGAWPAPRRVHVDVSGGLSLCDYMAVGEALSSW